MTKGNEPVTLVHDENGSCTHLGLTKREYFAAKAMQGILSSMPKKIEDMQPLLEYYSKEYPTFNMFECVAAEAVGQADALIEALNK